MKKQTILIGLFLLFTLFGFANEVEIQLSKKEKVMRTFSGDLNHKKGFQSVLIKNGVTKKYEILPIFINENGKITYFERVSYKKEPRIISFHMNNENLTLLVKEKYKDKEIQIIDINTISKKITSKVIKRKLASEKIIRLNDKTILFNKIGRKLVFTSIENGENIDEKDITFEKGNELLRTFFKDDNITVVNTNEFVKNGSITANSIYYVDGSVLFINNIKSKTSLLSFDLDNLKNYKTIEIDNNEFEKIKDSNTFLYGDKVISTVTGKDDTIIKITNILDNKNDFNISVKDKLASLLDKKLVEGFLKNASKSKFKPTVTANTSKDNNIVINIDFVEKSKYYYQHDWWMMHWMMQQQMLHMQQMQHINNMSHNFGPNIQNEYDVFSSEEKKTSMQFVLSPSFKVLPEASKETKFIEYDSYLEQYKEDKAKKKLTAVFTKDNYYIIYYSKETKKIIIEKKSLS